MAAPYMDPSLLAENYVPKLNMTDTILARDLVERFIENYFREELNCFKHPTPLGMLANTGVNDDLDGSDHHQSVRFHVANLKSDRGVKVDLAQVKETHGLDAEIVQSLAKLKRIWLKRYDIPVGSGLFCTSTSIRKGYFADTTHSNVCDQWDWERVITEDQRNLEFLKEIVRGLWKMITDCETQVHAAFPAQFEGAKKLPKEITFVTPDEMHTKWPNADVHEREDAAVQEWGAIFILGMGWPLSDGSPPEEVRAPDYDNWLLNGDIMVLHPTTGRRHELSSMGIRVDRDDIIKQCEHRNRNELLSNPYHQAVLNNELPLCIGGGIGISRLVMLVTQCAHIGEVQVGIWHPEHVTQAEQAGCKIIPDHL